AVAGALRDGGSDVRTGHKGVRVEAVGNSIAVHTGDGARVEGERLLVATGRRMNLPGIGLGSVGLDEAAHSVPVDERLRAADKLWAIRDITPTRPFTPLPLSQ